MSNLSTVIISHLKKEGASVQRADYALPDLLIVGYNNETFLLMVQPQANRAVQSFLQQWRGRKVYTVKSPDEALAVIGIGNRWIAWRIERDQIIIKAVKEALRYKSGLVHAEDILPWQDLYTTVRGLRRSLVDMEARGLILRFSKNSGYTLAKTH